MSIDDNEWIDSVWSTLRAIPTGGAVEELEAAWRELEARDKPVAVVFGAYDAGKSSLLKRLLFEDGAPVPPALTVSGRRETFSVDEFAGALWTFRDGPGLAGGNDEHDLKALESLELADLLVWVLPPQLVTSNKATFDAIVSGERFGVGPPQVAASLVAVLSRIDEAGIDPAENPDGFADLCERKRLELIELLGAVGAPPPRWGIHAVSADPYQGVGNDPPDASTYGMGAGWDGVPALRQALAEAHREASALRTLAGYRFASRAISILGERVREEQAGREEGRASCENELERIRLWRASLDALRRKSAADLHRAVEEELLSASRMGAANAAEALQQRLADAVDRWSEQACGELERLAASADQEAGERRRSPSMQRLGRLIIEMNADENERERPGRGGRLKGHATRLARAFREGFKAYARVDLGMSLEEAAKHMRALEESGQAWAAFRKANKGNTFKSEALARKASNYVRWAEALDAVGPLAEELGPLLFDIGGEVLSAIDARKRALRRSELRAALGAAALEVEREAMTGFDDVAATFGEWLDQQERMHRETARALDAQIAALRHHEAELESLLRRRPRSTPAG